jgi:hypothetical protein
MFLLNDLKKDKNKRKGTGGEGKGIRVGMKDREEG